MWAFHASDAAEDHIRGLESMESKGASNVVLYEQQCKVSGKETRTYPKYPPATVCLTCEGPKLVVLSIQFRTPPFHSG